MNQGINFTNAKLSKLIVHSVGTKTNEDENILSDSVVRNVSKEMEEVILNYFLSPFKSQEYFSFWHESELELNTLFSFSRDIFHNKNSFIKKSQHIAKHLYECSTHPQIQRGDLFISYFENLVLDEEEVEAIGIFKSESKDKFLNVFKFENHFEVSSQEGTGIKNIDKGCVIFRLNEDEGFKLCLFDNLARTTNAKYWTDDFIKAKPCKDEFQHTKNFLALTKEYVEDHLPDQFEVSKADQIDILKRSIDYFKENENFSKKEFEKEVFQDTGIISSFRKFGNDFQERYEIDIEEQFEISQNAVKKQSRLFKSVLKLDKNFHIYIHGDRELIEKGVEKNGRKYYKIYYEEES